MKRKTPKLKFVGLHGHSTNGSPFDALGYPGEYMDFAYQNGMDALALTDHGNCNGLTYQVQHAQKMNEEGRDFKPIYGVEAYFLPDLDLWKEVYEAKKNKKEDELEQSLNFEDENRSITDIIKRRNHLVILAQNQTGLNNVFQLVSKSFEDGNFYRFPRIDFKMLEEHNEGLIVSSACLGGVFAGDWWRNRKKGGAAVKKAMRETASRFLDILGDRFYAELQWNSIMEQHIVNLYVIEIAREFGIPLISSADHHYPRPELWQDRELYKKLGWGSTHDNDKLPQSIEEVGYELYPKNGDEMFESYRRHSQNLGLLDLYDDNEVIESIETTYHIAHDRIDCFYPENSVKLPSFIIPEGENPDRLLARKCIQGLKQKGFGGETEYITRLKEELLVIAEKDFSTYFLTMEAIARFAQERQIMGPARGSGAGSLVNYVLNISQINPLKYGLQFSRFLRKDQKDYPDIDSDFSDRIGLVEELIREWGEDCVVPISNWNKLKPKSTVKDVARFYGVPFVEVNKVTKISDSEAVAGAKDALGMKSGAYQATFEDWIAYSDTYQKFALKYPRVHNKVENLLRQVRSQSRHAGGVVISENLSYHMPLVKSKGVTQTPWGEGNTARHLEPFGFIKFDLLGLSTLEMIRNCIGRILERHHGIDDPTFSQIREFYIENLHPDSIDLEDKEVWKNIYHKGRWAGTFQFTEENAQRFCTQVKPNNIVESATITSIQRPGPLSANVDKDYVATRMDMKNPAYYNDIYKEITEETLGFLIFQEQIAMLAHRLGKGISLDEGNTLRKLLTKKGVAGVEEKKRKIYEKFIEGCEEKGIKQKIADKIWSNMEFFSGYGFNKSHAVSYSVISYQCAWLFNYYPAEWLCAFLDDKQSRSTEKLMEAIDLVKSYGYKIRGVDINHSTDRWEIYDDTTLMQSFVSIKGIGESATEYITLGRPYDKIEDLIFSDVVPRSKVNKTVKNALLRVGAFDSIIERDDRFTGPKHFWEVVVNGNPGSKKKFEKLLEDEELKHPSHWTADEYINNIIAFTGTYPVDRVAKKEIRDELESCGVRRISATRGGACWFIVRDVALKKTKSGKHYYEIMAIDNTFQQVKVRIWGADPSKDKVYPHKMYVAELDYSPEWGYSIRAGRDFSSKFQELESVIFE